MTLALCGCGSLYLVTVEDVVCPVGQKAHLIGKLEYRGVAVFHKGIDDRDVRFLIDGRCLGQDDTNDEGYARMSIFAEMARRAATGWRSATTTVGEKRTPRPPRSSSGSGTHPFW